MDDANETKQKPPPTIELSNPTVHPVKFRADGVLYKVPAHGSLVVPLSAFPSALAVQCDSPICARVGGFCRRGHEGYIHGGLAPQLQYTPKEN